MYNQLINGLFYSTISFSNNSCACPIFLLEKKLVHVGLLQKMTRKETNHHERNPNPHPFIGLENRQ